MFWTYLGNKFAQMQYMMIFKQQSITRSATPERLIPEVDISCIDPKLGKALLPFQKSAVYFGIHLKGRVLIADDMGLGKTLQALAIAHYYLTDWPLLILTPSSMKFAWEEAIRVWLPSVPLHHLQVSNFYIAFY